MAELGGLLREMAELIRAMQAIQDDIIQETGGLDQTVYRQRLEDAGLKQKFDALKSKIAGVKKL